MLALHRKCAATAAGDGSARIYKPRNCHAFGSDAVPNQRIQKKSLRWTSQNSNVESLDLNAEKESTHRHNSPYRSA